jgi:phosphate transport system substrate-binding protein
MLMNMFVGLARGIAAAGLVALSTSVAMAADISGAGATFPAPIYSKWAEAYKAQTGVGLNYQSVGSGAGLKAIDAKTVTFGASDIPVTAEDQEKKGLVMWPMVMGGIVAVVNLDGVKADDLFLDGDTLANIFLGKVKSWDDAAIKKLNPSVTLPASPIVVVRRADGSGTTYNFTNYLAKVSKEWADKIGVSQTPEWPAGVGAKGNDGVAGQVAQTKGSIGYVEYSFAKQQKLAWVDMVNKAGKKVKPTVETFQAAAASADWAGSKGYYVVLTDQPGEAAWPMTAATFILMYKEPVDKAASTDALKFFDWAFKNGSKMAEDLDYIPMPASVVDLVAKTWAKDIKNN